MFNPDFGRGIKYSFYLGSYTLVQEPQLDNILTIYPNPTSKELFITSDNSQKIASVEIYDLQGNLIIKKSFDNTVNTTLSISIYNLNKGTYLAKIFSSQNIITRKFIVE